MSEILHGNDWLAEKLGVSKQTARTLHLKTDIPVIKFSRLCKYRESDIDRWLDAKRQGAVCGR